ncbi:hypothetical protein EDD22DRAFT_947651 [Suillus occidentalis]|nr:hypothetical protein EDD22DRAFT_947651 [Suillus occidentalis]
MDQAPLRSGYNVSCTASLSTSLIAALGAVLGKQWLGHFIHCGRGPIDVRGRLRQQKMDGPQTWYSSAVLEVLPLLIHVSLLLFGIALGASIWTRQPMVLTMALGALFYGSIVISCVISPTYPFQTTPSTILRFAFLTTTSWVHLGIARGYATDRDSTLPHRTDAPHKASAVHWIMETNTDPHVVTSAALTVPEVEWPKLIDVSAAIVQLRDTFRACFESTPGRQPKLGLHARTRTLACGKALVHLQLLIGHILTILTTLHL